MESRQEQEGVSSTPGENEYPSGFPQSICDDIPQEKYLCSNCNNVLNKAHQTMCGHRYCLACVNWLVRNNKNLVCKKCKEEDPSLENTTSILISENFFNDAAINKEILELKVHCSNQGCTWKSTLKDFEEHQSQCEHALISCNIGCGHMVVRKALAGHLEHGCPNNMSVCQTCFRAMSHTELLKHKCQDIEEKKPTKPKRGQKQNQPIISPPKEACVFYEVGCTFKGDVEKLKAHESCRQVDHLQLLLQATSNLQASMPMAPGKRKEAKPGEGPLPALRSLSAIQLHGGEGEEEASVAQSLRDDQVNLLLGQQVEELQQKVKVSENIISVLNREIEKTQQTVVALETKNQRTQETIMHLEIKVAEQQQRLDRKEQIIISMRESIATYKDLSYDGTFIWKVNDLSQKMKEAISGHRNNQYSPAFYTARYGFKVCMRLYLNGDGVGKGTHISLFFVVMKGEYDPLLLWPFKHKVTFFLLDQNQKEHVIDAFRPDLRSSSFQRPVSEMNVASGCPVFFPLRKLHSPKHAYCKDDTLFIKCVVDTS